MLVRTYEQKLRDKCAELGIAYINNVDAAAKLAARFGIVDIDVVPDNAPTVENILLAAKLMEKHAASVYARLEERRRMQQKNGR